MLIHMSVATGITDLACLVSGCRAPANLYHKMRYDPYMWPKIGQAAGKHIQLMDEVTQDCPYSLASADTRTLYRH